MSNDMKQVLLKLGHNLVQEHDFQPANMLAKVDRKTTEPLVRFLVWLDQHAEAREELERMGFTFLRTVA